MTLGLIILLGCLTTLIEAQVLFLGPCPDLKTMPDFDAEKYLGEWYEAEKYFFIFELGGKCITANYTSGADGTINVTNKQISTITGTCSSITGEARKNNSGNSAQLQVKFQYVPVEAPYWILETDYDNYAVVYSCNNFGLFSARNCWILTRERNPPLSIMEKAYSVVDKNQISRAYLMRTDQKNCSKEC